MNNELRKRLVALGLASSLAISSMGCANQSKEETTEYTIEDTYNDENIEQVEETETTNEVVSSVEEKDEKQELIDLLTLIIYSDYNDSVKDIMMNIALNSTHDRTINNLKLACSTDLDNLKDIEPDYFLCSLIMEASREGYVNDLDIRRYYELDNLKVYDNRDYNNYNMPGNISLLEHINTLGNYKFYCIHGSKAQNGRDKFEYVVTDLSDKIVAYCDMSNEIYRSISSDTTLSSFEDFLKNNNLSEEIQKEYTYVELFRETLFNASIKLDQNNYNEYVGIKPENGLTNSTHNLEDYYVLEKLSRYMFGEHLNVYKDTNNPSARVFVDDEFLGFVYEDDKNGIFMYEDSNFIYNESDTHCIEVISKNQYVKSK